jgi:hypothetical protein
MPSLPSVDYGRQRVRRQTLCRFDHGRRVGYMYAIDYIRTCTPSIETGDGCGVRTNESIQVYGDGWYKYDMCDLSNTWTLSRGHACTSMRLRTGRRRSVEMGGVCVVYRGIQVLCTYVYVCVELRGRLCLCEREHFGVKRADELHVLIGSTSYLFTGRTFRNVRHQRPLCVATS